MTAPTDGPAGSSERTATLRDLRALPKAHLHLHLEAGMRESTLREMAAELSIEVPKLLDFNDFTEFDAAYQTLFSVLDTPERFARLIDEVVADAAEQGAVYAELGVVPIMYESVFGSAPEALEAMIDAAAIAADRHGVGVGLMPTINRMAGPEAALEVARLAVQYAGRGVVSLGLAYEERGFPAEQFTEAYDLARRSGLLSTPHAGELVGAESVRAAVSQLGADRVQHGVRVLEQPDLVEQIADAGICLDVCPTSNLLLDVVASLESHPLPTLLTAGVRCSINADDPILFQTDVLSEYQVARDQIGLTDDQLAACAWSSVDCSGASDAVKRWAQIGIDEWLVR